MKTKLWISAVLALGLALVIWNRSSLDAPRALRLAVTGVEVGDEALTPGEQQTRRLIREVHAKAIVSERLIRDGEEVKLSLELDPTKAPIPYLTCNLTTLARQQREQRLSDATLKAGLEF